MIDEYWPACTMVGMRLCWSKKRFDQARVSSFRFQ